MSLIVFFSTDAGIVVVGDRATTGAQFAIGGQAEMAGGTVKSASKVFAFDDNTVFGITGTSSIDFVMDDGTSKIAFSAPSLIIDYGRTHAYSSDSDDFWGGMVERVATELMSKAPPGPVWTPAVDGFMFQGMFAHVPKDKSKWSYRCLRLFVFLEGDKVRIEREVVPHAMPGVHAIGNDLVYQQITSGNDPRFDDVRNEATIRLPAERRCTHDEAIAFAKRICAVTSERRLLVEPVDTGHNVSVETDGWIVKPTGWQKLYKNER
jgi:hypothetical protein